MNKKELKEIIKVYSFEVNWLKNKNKQLENENNKLKGYIDGIEKQLTLADVSNNEVALKAFVEEFVEAWEDGMGGDSSLYDAAKRLL